MPALHYVRKGSGYPVVLIHGFPFSHTMWEPQIEMLSKDYDVIAPDLPGFGGSPVVNPITIAEMADQVAELLSSLEIRKCIIVGFSMGGYVSFELLQRHSELAGGLVLADTKAGNDTEEGKAGRRKLAEAVIANGSGAASEAMLGKLLAPNASTVKPELVQQVDRMIREASPEAIAAASLAMAERADMTSSLGDIRIPVLVLVGSEDGITPPDGAKQMASAISEASVKVIDQAGHLANLEQPQAFTEALLEWLKKYV
ncbi:alpha/beta fold hydrolase [Paenibacillus turpanensis]|uniref:alpha/beta fold hydrolase n=1 Tax=Paenibacillus turpanensis TaxID=2689078 RepID=UPI00140E3D26|nr:alpha/beta fold hydrolase [Paenibacillus turpanensis]